MLIAEYYVLAVYDEELRFQLSDTHLSVENLKTGSKTSLELGQISEVRLSTWKRSGDCLVRDRRGQTLRIPSTSYNEDQKPEHQIEEYTDFLDALHTLLRVQAPHARCQGTNFRSILTGSLVSLLSLLVLLVFSSFFLMEGRTDAYQSLFLTLGVLGACGLVVGVPTLTSGLPRRYNNHLMPPVRYLPAPSNLDLVVSRPLGRPQAMKVYGRHHIVMTIGERPRNSNFLHPEAKTCPGEQRKRHFLL